MISLSFDGAIARLVINRPERRNAITADMCDALIARCREIDRSAARVVLLSGAGGTFCAGGDIHDWSARSAAAFADHWVREGHDAFDALARIQAPVIAVLDGPVLGGGLELAACADLRIAEAQVKLGQPETGLGIIPGWSGTQRATRRFGAQVVRRMAVFGEVFDAEEARALGLVDHVTPTGGAMATAEDYAQKVCARAPRATTLTKMLINAAEGEEVGRVLESFAGHIAAQSPALTEGLAAFRGKRRPDFPEEE